VPDWLLKKLDNEFDTFHEQIDTLEKAQTLNAAREDCRKACRYSRRTLLLLFLARLGYDNKEQKIERFAGDLTRALNSARHFAKTYASEEDLFCDRVENMGLRAKVVEALLDNDMDRAHDLLKEMIDRALKALAEEEGNATR
jgi:hypothetical protein